jgi:hypothetical protein
MKGDVLFQKGLEKGTSFFHIPFNGIELRFLGGRRDDLRRCGRRRWRSGRNYNKVDNKGKGNEERS